MMKFFSTLFFILFLIFFSSCKKNNFDAKPKTFLALGDSYTIGEGVPDSLAWPYQLVSQINKHEVYFDKPKIIAKTGWTTDELLFAIDSINLKGTYDYVSLLIGVNNQYRELSLEDFKFEFKKLIEKAIIFSGNMTQNIFVLSIPDWSVMPYSTDRDRNKISKQIDEFNLSKEIICNENGINFIDVTKISRNAKYNPSLVALDSLHPSEKMYKMWVNEIIDQLNLD